MEIKCKEFNTLTVEELYDLLQLRSEIFVVEQDCPYQDLDGIDKRCHHLLIYKESILQAYARLIPEGLTFNEHSIGRVVTKNHGLGFGSTLMNEAIQSMYRIFGPIPIRIGAQTYATNFYTKFGFLPDGEVYDEDGIEHIEMILKLPLKVPVF